MSPPDRRRKKHLAEAGSRRAPVEVAGARPLRPGRRPGAWSDRFPPGRYGVFVAALAALAFGLVLARGMTYGPVVTNDSVHYTFVAGQLLAGEGFTTWDAREIFRPYVEWPPFYPILLALARLLGLELLSAVHWLNAAFFSLAVLVVGRYAARHFRSPFLWAWTPVAVALSLPFARFASYGTPGALFTLLTLLALLRLCEFLEEGDRSSLAWSAVFAGLAFSTRYQGVVLVAYAGLLLLLRPGRRVRENFRNAAGYGAIAGLPTAFWLVRNYFVSGTLTGRFPAPEYDAAEIGGDIGSVALSWFRFDAGSAPLLALGAVIPLAALLLPPRSGTPRGAGLSSPPGGGRRALVFGGFTLAFVGLYLVAIMLELSSHGVEARHLFPARLPLVLAFATALDPLFGAGRGRRVVRILQRVGAVAAAALLSVWAAGQVGLQRREIARANSAEVLFKNGEPRFYNGYLSEPWASSETRRFLQAGTSTGSQVVYSNRFPFALMEIGDPRRIRRTPNLDNLLEPPGGVLSTPQERLASLVERAPEGARVVWYEPRYLWPPYRFPAPAALFEAPGLRPLAEFDDGAAFVVDRGYSPPANRYREAYEFLRTEEPDAEADFEVYFDRGSRSAAKGPTLFYRRARCRKEFLREKFFLHVVPEERGVLPAERAPYGFENLDFHFVEMGVLLDLAGGERACLAMIRLPNYRIARVRTGQFRTSGPAVWSVEIRPE